MPGMKGIRLLASLSLAAILTSCAPQGGPKSAFDAVVSFDQPSPRMLDPKGLKTVDLRYRALWASHVEAVCESIDGTECDPSEAMALVEFGGEMKKCAALLVAQDLLKLELSCVPAGLRTQEADCSDRIVALFPEHAGYASESVTCRGIEMDPENAEVLLVRLDRQVTRPTRSFAAELKGVGRNLSLLFL